MTNDGMSFLNEERWDCGEIGQTNSLTNISGRRAVEALARHVCCMASSYFVISLEGKID
jgi:hypothetical protein